jgi:N-acyl-D-amino-acid deacylase
MAFNLVGGVTTCIVGNCGSGAAPHAAAAVMAKTLHPGVELREWRGYAGYMARLEQQPTGVNIGVLAGHGTARLAAMGTANRAPGDAEMAAMKATLAEALEAGALGLSSGLVYDPGRFAATDELVELCALMRGTGALYATHMRDESTGLLDSVREAIAIGERAGVPVQISHHKASGRSAWGWWASRSRSSRPRSAAGLTCTPTSTRTPRAAPSCRRCSATGGCAASPATRGPRTW